MQIGGQLSWVVRWPLPIRYTANHRHDRPQGEAM